MTETSKDQGKRIISTLLHQIDVDSKACTLIPISSDYSDLEGRGFKFEVQRLT